MLGVLRRERCEGRGSSDADVGAVRAVGTGGAQDAGGPAG